MSNKPRAYILIGLPATGKSTWIKISFHSAWTPIQKAAADGPVVISSDNNVQWLADARGQTYDEAWASVIKDATKMFWHQLDTFSLNKVNMVVDRTNVDVKSRRPIINTLKKAGYAVEGVVFGQKLSVDEWLRRLSSRPGKNIPFSALTEMAKRYEFPSKDEGFDRITIV